MPVLHDTRCRRLGEGFRFCEERVQVSSASAAGGRVAEAFGAAPSSLRFERVALSVQWSMEGTVMRVNSGNANAHRLRAPKASDLLANELRARILEAALPAGSPLPSEHELMAEHELSRGTVREALRLLETDGFIRIQRGPKGGIRVHYPDVHLVSNSLGTLLTLNETPLRNLFFFRKLVEPSAAGVVARVATVEQKEALLAVTEGPIERRGTAVFHQSLSECISDDLLRVIITALNQVVEWHAGIEHVGESDLQSAGHAHEAIARAILDGDGEKASALMLRHLEAFEAVMERAGRLNEPILPRRKWVALLRSHSTVRS